MTIQPRLILRRCPSVLQNSRRRAFSTSSSTITFGDTLNRRNGISSPATTTARLTRRSDFLTLQSFQTQIITEHMHQHKQPHRYVQSSSTSKSPVVPKPRSASSSSSSSPSSMFSRNNMNMSMSRNTGDATCADDEVLKFTNDSIQKLLQDELFAIESTLQQPQNSNISPFENVNHDIENIETAQVYDNIDKDMDFTTPQQHQHPLNNSDATNTIEDEMKFDIKQTLKQQLREIQQQQKMQKPQNMNQHKGIPSVNTRPSMAELLKSFRPQSPPPEDAPLEEAQEWLEVAAQQESVQKYEAMIQNTRERQDYTSMSLVQRHLLEWYNPLRNKILKEQQDYYSSNKKNKGANKYGPLLCTLQAEKIALLTTHEATMIALQKGGDNAKLVAMACRIGEAVEAEVNVQRALKERMDDRALYKKEQRKANTAVTASAESELELDDGSKKLSDGEDKLSIASKAKNINSTTDWMYGPSHLQRFIDDLNRSNPSRKGKVRIQRANRRAMQMLESVEPWPTADKILLGVVLINMLLETAKVDLRGRGRRLSYDEEGNLNGLPAFEYQKKWVNDKKLVGYVTMNEDFYKMIVEDKFCSLDPMTSRHKPMVVPPIDWTSPFDGGYTILKTEFMRTRGCQLQVDALREADLTTVMDGLNVLGKVPWVINKKILSAAEKCWDGGIVLGDIPSRVDHDLPPAPIRPDGNNKEYEHAQGEFQNYRMALMKYRRIHQKNMDLRSLRCSALLKLNQADQFKEFEKIYFPYNLDFRGRAYPVPPHLSNIGSDLCRGMLTFAEPKPLGPRGLYWLKVHLANLAGNDKISFDERAEFTERNMENVRACVNDPFGENRWWMSLDDPFQALATCNEIVTAIDSGSPETYESSLPVHMDGSCNGLQHYAALGRDKLGGKAVNLCPLDKPEDVYSGVMEEVIRRIAEEAGRLLDVSESDPDKLSKNQKKALADHRAAKLVNGLIDRGVVKRTVMTSVYGVTYIGAKKQIHEKIEEKLEEKGVDVDEMEDEIFAACGYLARVTMDVMGDLFQGARQTMNWLTTCAKLISSQGQPVSWMSPTGVPAVQPYRKRQPYTIVTLLQTVVLISNNDNLPSHKARQTTAFPPNYIHSLDSAHMLLTAIEMDKRGLTFSAVHDSFWTHAADIDEMNDVLRCSFIDLYNRPLLEELLETWELQYPSLNFPDLPERGDLDLNDVRKAPYFFQ